MNLILTRKQLLAEKAHLGPAFNYNEYIVIKNNKINEGGGIALFLSLPAIIKLFRFAIDKGQEHWLKVFNKDLYEKIDKRTLMSLLDENSIEDIAANLSEVEAEKTKKLIKVIKKITGVYKILDKQSGVPTPHDHRPEEDEQGRALRFSRETPGNKVQMFSEVLGALQHGLHHLYSSAFNLVGSVITANLPGSKKLSEESYSKISDLIGNLLFVALICFLLFGGGLHVDSMSAVKCLEIFAEGIECWEAIMASTIIVPTALRVIKEVIAFLNRLTTQVVDKVINSIFGQKLEALKNFFKDQNFELNSTLHSSRFSPEILRSDSGKNKRKKANRSDPRHYDYYGNPIMDSYIRQYIKLFFS